MYKKIKKIFFGFLILLFLLPSLVLADGMMLPPPDRYIFETDQQAVIFFEDGVETLILSTSFKGDADNFAWVIPTPTRPKVEKASKEIFTALRDLTEVIENYPRPQGLKGVQFGLEDAIMNVHVLEEKKIEYYDIAVLAADDKDALARWLNEHDYHFPEQYSYVLDSYIKNKWVFTAVKITKDIDSDVLRQNMWSGSLIPLQLEFLTNKPVYPLKISSVIEEPSFKKNEPNYINGVLGKAVEINKNEKIFFDSSNFNAQEGTIEMIVKVDQKNNEQANATFLTINNKSSEKFYFGVQGGMLQLHIYDESFGHFNPMTWSAGFSGRKLNFSNLWNNVAVSWKQGEVPKFYFNGSLLPAVYPLNKVIPEVFDNRNILKQVYIGGSKFSKPLKSIYIDAVKISSVFNRIEEYKLEDGKKYSFDESTIMLASFDGNLNYLDKRSIVKKLDYFNSLPNPPKINYQKPSQVGIELYIFTPDKEQTLPGFTTRYAAWTDKKTIEDLAMDDNGEPWMEVKNKKYYLTKLFRYMKYSDMDNDLFFRNVAQNSDTGDDTERPKTAFYIIISLAILIILSISITIIYQFNKD